MYVTHQQEAFSRAFVAAIASAAGFKVGPGGEPDDDSVDLVIGATGPVGRMRSPKLEVQLKSKLGAVPVTGFSYDLKAKNYADLSGPLVEYQAPRILIVVFMPEDVQQWAEQEEALILRHRAIWTCLHDSPPSQNLATVRIRLAVENVFTPEGLKGMMERVGAGERP